MTATLPEKKESWGSAEKAVLEEGKSGLFVLDGSGDSRFMWSKDNPDEVAAAKTTFQRLKEKGYDAFKVSADGSKSEKITEFDPTMEKIIMAPRMVGG
jgi:hypothetical protein